ncbi:SDR family oxidoreductase [Flavimarina sp. Hel_I_48]|uniref:SDR family oxidoreductase n=1 Tax=Flavimarina sp. Hel_I_48 TaxID=1392488 RepID=UPI0004DF1B35|nr:SDR family oxidoreductase [Flavimarina sp. Hel_I_48]
MENLERPGQESEMKKKPLIIRENYRGSGKLNHKNALITGGDSGIGRAVAVHFAKEGCNIMFTYVSEHEDAEKTKKLVEAEGVKCSFTSGDLRDITFCKDLIEEFKNKYSTLDILVNNAATQYTVSSLEDIKEEHVRETFDLNIISMILLTKNALPLMKEGGRIINTTSITSYRGHKDLVDYSSTKGAITSFTRSMSAQLASKNILVNAVAPGPIWTPLIPATMDDEMVTTFGEDTPLGRCGQPSEVAPAYVYLASEDSSYMTGQVLHINGGSVIGG